ncbi:hypothetical protein BC835DRAFT_1260395, partial [Cytidiella melzeri]
MMETDEAEFDQLQEEYTNEDADEFHITNRLPAPQAMMYCTKDLHQLIHMGEIDLEPPYQRATDVVWPEAKQMRLIDSIYHNYYVPPIVFAIVQDGEYTVRRCVDGKQRLTSIQKFFDGQVRAANPITKKSFWYTVSETATNRREVPQYWKDDFANKTLTCVEYTDLQHGFERDIFQRVQLGIPLTVAEKLQAISSPWAEYISQLKDMRLNEGIAAQIEVDTTRGRDFQAVAQLVYCCEGIPDQRFPTASKLDQWLHRKDYPRPSLKDEITKTMQMFQHIASTPGLDMGFTQVKNRVAPVEFVFIGVLLFVMRRCTYPECAQAILDMRQSARSQHKDIRANNVIVKYLWNFIANAT